MTLTSSVLSEGATVPNSMVFNGMGCTGEDTSPDLTWTGAPAETKSYAITMYDPDAPTTVGFTHWVLFDIPADVLTLKAGAGSHSDAQVHAMHGINDYGHHKYGGPCPPAGDPPHHYHITVWALDVPKLEGLDKNTSYAKLRFMIRQHTLASGELLGLYGH